MYNPPAEDRISGQSTVHRSVNRMNIVVNRRSLAVALAASLVAAASLTAQISVRGNTIREQRAQPGETYSGTFTVVNASAEPQEAKLYQTDYFTSADGTNAYAAPGSSARSNARWIGLDAITLVIPPLSSRDVTFHVAVPLAGSLSGTYWSMIMVEGVPRGSGESNLPSTGRQEVRAAVVTRVRYAVQVATHVGAATKPAATFAAPAVHVAADGAKVLQFDVANTGIRSFAPAFTLEVYSADGARVKSASPSREMLYPGTSLRQHFDLGTLPAGTYRALVTLDAGENTVFGAQYTLKL
jgi:hypothetical protein